MFRSVVVLPKIQFIESVVQRYNIASPEDMNRLGDKFYIVSINDTSSPLPLAFFHKNILTLVFDDITSSSSSELKNVTRFTDKHAEEIIGFLSSIPDDSTLVIHCSAGISRSGAVARFVSDMMGYSYQKLMADNPCIHPNNEILATLKREYYRKHKIFSEITNEGL